MEAINMVLSIFTRQQKMQLLPFVVSMVFFLFQPYPTRTFLGTIFKIIPLISLIGYVIVTRSQFPTNTRRLNAETVIPEDVYSFCILAGLCISVVGELFVDCEYLFLPCAVLFILVQLIYVVAIEISGRHRGIGSRYTWLFVLLYLDMWLCTQEKFESYFMKIFVMLFYIPLCLAGWKSYSAMEDSPDDKAVRMACVGASSFIVSDFLVFLYFAGCPIPFAEFLYMVTYYTAQFGWAVSTSTLN